MYLHLMSWKCGHFKTKWNSSSMNLHMKNFVIYSILTLIWKILRIFIYWLKVKWTSNCILEECCENIIRYNDSLKTSCHTWVDRILFEDSSVKQWRRLLKRDYWIFIEVKYIFVFYKFFVFCTNILLLIFQVFSNWLSCYLL